MPNIRSVVSLAITIAKEEILDNKVKIYGFNIEKKAYTSLVIKFPLLQKDDRFIKVLCKKQIKTPLKQGYQDKLKRRSKIYPFDIKDRKLVNEIFNKMHK